MQGPVGEKSQCFPKWKIISKKEIYFHYLRWLFFSGSVCYYVQLIEIKYFFIY